MNYEPGSVDCRVIIEAKNAIEDSMVSVSRVPNSIHLLNQLNNIHKELQSLHDSISSITNETNSSI
jgi:ABC-type uncharacterized transport system fused permease/ATPase subunit